MKDPDTLLEAYSILSEELRHTATVIWQFTISIATLQGGAIAISGQKDFDPYLGNGVMVIAFFLSLAFSLMLFRQATERSGFVKRIKAIEADLTEIHQAFSIEIPKSIPGFTSNVMAGLLIFESGIGLVFFLSRLCH